MTSMTGLDTATVLAGARRAKAESNRAEAELLAFAVSWARLHEVSDPDAAATFGDTPVLIAGPGAPMIGSYAIAEFAAVIGMSTNAGRFLVGQAIELAYRLPRVYARIQDGTLPAWKGRRIAEVTLDLTPEAAEYVDVRIAPFAHRTNPAETLRLINTAIATLMPDFAAERREAAAEGRHFTFNHNQVSFAGTTVLWGELDMADALDLDAVITAEAAALADLGNDQPLDVRRAQAVGNLARGQLNLGFETGASAPSSTNRSTRAQREVTIYVHLDPETNIARVENAGTHLVTKDQVAEWTGITGTKVFIRPVIDLNQPKSTSAYQVPGRIREHLILRDRICVFPHCTKNARHTDADHIEPYDPDGPPDQTNTDNLASLCRHHHRLKTHAGWTYTMLEPGTYLWSSPHGYQFLRDRHGTQDITPRPLEPPGG
ncbi:HNH endonuclease signature motif containing protein [Methylocystis sp.]|uniref:HNH endonuclease signature motif containing protein n=1 Tax=Methylocystis sp. TaxID=1911079 RepID=UPI003DA24F22